MSGSLALGGAAIAQVAFDVRERFFAVVRDDPEEAGEKGLERSLSLLAVAGAALALALLPVAVGLSILLGTTVPLEFGAGAGLAIVGSVKLAAMTAGILASIRTPQAAGTTL